MPNQEKRSATLLFNRVSSKCKFQFEHSNPFIGTASPFLEGYARLSGPKVAFKDNFRLNILWDLKFKSQRTLISKQLRLLEGANLQDLGDQHPNFIFC